MLDDGKMFDELRFFAAVKKRPGMLLGSTSLISLRDVLHGVGYAFWFCNQESPLKYFQLFIDWYHRERIKDLNGYACWWNHILYTSGNDDKYAFECFFRCFEQYLLTVHHLSLPEVQ